MHKPPLNVIRLTDINCMSAVSAKDLELVEPWCGGRLREGNFAVQLNEHADRRPTKPQAANQLTSLFVAIGHDK
jgi:hypothetical protein